MSGSGKRLLVGLDIGTSKIVALVGEMYEENGSEEIEVVGMGSMPSHGLKRGVVVNIESTVQAIGQAVKEAALMSGCEIHSVFAGISGSHIRSLPSHGTAPIRDEEVAAADITRVMESAKAVAIPADQRILHVLPNEFIVDTQGGIKHPIGMSGVRLEAKVHIITGAISAAENIAKCVRRCGLAVDDIVLQQLASGEAVLSEDETELGICLVDIGGGTTDIAVFQEGALQHTAVIPIAGDQVTNDIAVALRTPRKAAEAIKVEHGCVLPRLVEAEGTIEVPGVGERPPRQLSHQTLVEVIGARYEELLTLVHNELQRGGHEAATAAGVVLTGGSAKVGGLAELAEEIFQAPVRIGEPRHVTGLPEVSKNPAHATGAGLLLYGRKHSKGLRAGLQRQSGAGRAWQRLQEWLRKNF